MNIHVILPTTLLLFYLSGVVSSSCTAAETNKFCVLLSDTSCHGTWNKMSKRKNGDNPFEGVDLKPEGATNYGFVSPATIDMDNDGYHDLVFGRIDGTILYFKNTNPAFVNQSAADNPLSSVDVGGHAAPAAVDLDNDSDTDLVVGNENGYLYYFENIGTPTNPIFTQQTGENNPFDGIDESKGAKPALLDLDDDGDKDLVVGRYDGSLSYFKNTGSPTNPVYTKQFGTDNPFYNVDVGFRSSPAPIDLDKDGRIDMVVGTSAGKQLLFYKNTGAPTNPVFTQHTGDNNPFAGITFSSFTPSPAFINMNNGGGVGMVVGLINGDVEYYQMSVALAYTEQIGEDNPFATFDLRAYTSLSPIDMDKDNDIDIVAGK